MGTGIYEAREASILREQVESLKQQQQSPAGQLQQFASERDNALRQLADLREENQRLNRNRAELIRLRGEVGRLREVEQRFANIATNQNNQALRYQQHKHATEEIKQIAMGAQYYAISNNWQYPTNFEQLKNGLTKIGYDWLFSTNFVLEPHLRKGQIQTDSFEFVNIETFSKPLRKNPGVLMLLRERNAFQRPDGKWERVYGMSGGGSELVISEDGNFEVWETEHSSIIPGNR